MHLHSKDIEDLYFNNPNLLNVNDIGLIHVTEPDGQTVYGLAFALSHMETGIEYRQMFLISPNIFEELTVTLQTHYDFDKGNEQSL